MRLFEPAVAALGTVALAAVALAQEPCTAARLPISIVRTNVPLTPTQEADLGDAMAEHLERSYGVVRGQENEHLQALGDRIVAELPPSGLTFHFTLVNMAAVNAFATPGGRIYVSRKLVAFANNDDEVAGVLGHEIGHILTRQLAAEVVETFRRVLKVSTFGDRKDIFEKYHRLVDSDGRRSDDGHSGEDHQYRGRPRCADCHRAGRLLTRRLYRAVGSFQPDQPQDRQLSHGPAGVDPARVAAPP